MKEGDTVSVSCHKGFVAETPGRKPLWKWAQSGRNHQENAQGEGGVEVELSGRGCVYKRQEDLRPQEPHTLAS